ncbi:uncharacterized protein LOC106150892 [Lingula anatina]|uniref:Uncharacterized protein LOC106150892 n=1 Tax=Lingula anatina TaxID=7574 RepID=A0A1S3H039_LINAN|nr:uncharacterized protein LOC106150892 [Lingula anatina]|eukprot:XP_013379368.1 uncharacterized protein LOC106150892 [Lingula anatina]
MPKVVHKTVRIVVNHAGAEGQGDSPAVTYHQGQQITYTDASGRTINLQAGSTKTFVNRKTQPRTTHVKSNQVVPSVETPTPRIKNDQVAVSIPEMDNISTSDRIPIIHQDQAAVRQDVGAGNISASDRLKNHCFVSDTQRLSYGANQDQANLGHKLITSQTEKPLNPCIATSLEVFMHCVFLANLVFTIADIAVDPNFLHFKIPALIIGILENIVLLVIYFYLKLRYYKNKNTGRTETSEEDKHRNKRIQYITNLCYEFLLYPIIIFTVFGLAVGKDYQFGNAWQITGMILLFIDLVDLSIVYVSRMYMVRRLVKDMELILNVHGFKVSERTGFCGGILTRTYICIVGNSFLFAVMLLLLGFQIHADNYISEDYLLSFRSAFMILCTVLIPFLSLVNFILVNYYWILECLLLISKYAARDFGDAVEVYREKYGEAFADTLEHIIRNTEANESRIRDIQQVAPMQKFLYGTQEWWIIILVILFNTLAMSIPAFYQSDPHSGHGSTFAIAAYIVVLIASNIQTVATLVLLLLIGFAFVFTMLYEICQACCCRQTS